MKIPVKKAVKKTYDHFGSTFFITMLMIGLVLACTSELVINIFLELTKEKSDEDPVKIAGNTIVYKAPEIPKKTANQVVEDTMKTISRETVFYNVSPAYAQKATTQQAVKETMNNITNKSVFYIKK